MNKCTNKRVQHSTV